LEQRWQLFPRFLSQGRAKGEVDPDYLIDLESGADFTPIVNSRYNEVANNDYSDVAIILTYTDLIYTNYNDYLAIIIIVIIILLLSKGIIIISEIPLNTS
jgi:hypothetical protein